MIVQDAPADPLSDVLALVRARAVSSVRLEAGGDWSLRFRPEAAKFNIVRSGSCWLVVDDESRRLQAGDCLYVKEGAEFVLASDPGLASVEASIAFADDPFRGRYGVGKDVDLLGGSISFATPDPSPLVDILPPTMVVEVQRSGAGQIAWLLEQLDDEWKRSLPGGRAVCDHLLGLVFVHALRTHFRMLGTQAPGWVAAMAEPSLAAAIRAIHAEPGRQWRLGELAGVAGQSRSTFAARFRERVGTTPVGYATAWRLAVAAAKLADGLETASSVAASLGFLSDSAFGAAFKRRYGVSPGRFRTSRRAMPLPDRVGRRSDLLAPSVTTSNN